VSHENILGSVFFITLPVGLESLGEEELVMKWPMHFPNCNYTVIARVMGGIEIECATELGFLLNHILKCPTRILLRLHSFKCRDVPKLFQKTSKFKWGPYLLTMKPEVHISATESRLFDSRKIEKAFHDGVAECFRHQPMKKKYQEQFAAAICSPEIFIRFDNDTCTFSLDTTGEILHKRGEKLLTGLAPIRESLASLLLLALGKNTEDTLIDPMCGSGTFLIEAHDFFKTNIKRKFSYMNTPLYQELKTPFLMPQDKTEKLFSNFRGYDNSLEIINEAKLNINERQIILQERDIFSNVKELNEKYTVIINPPYGKRVGNKDEIDVNYYLRILRSININYSPTKIGIIIPQDYVLRSTSEFTITRTIPFKNGGIPVVFYIFKCQK
jgi:putative N6-adenine-specific DNA methylase